MEPQTVDNHYLTVCDPTIARQLLAGCNMSAVDDHFQSPASPGTGRPVSTAGHSGGVVVRLCQRTDRSRPVDNRRSVILLDRQRMDRRAKHVRHRPTLRRFESTPSSRYSVVSPSRQYPVTPP